MWWEENAIQQLCSRVREQSLCAGTGKVVARLCMFINTVQPVIFCGTIFPLLPPGHGKHKSISCGNESVVIHSYTNRAWSCCGLATISYISSNQWTWWYLSPSTNIQLWLARCISQKSCWPKYYLLGKNFTIKYLCCSTLRKEGI